MKKHWVSGNCFDRKACLERGRFVRRDSYGKWATSFYWGKSGASPRIIFILGFLKSAVLCILSYQRKKITFVYPHLFVPLNKLFLVFEWPAPLWQLKAGAGNRLLLQGDFIRSPELLGNPLYEWGLGVYGCKALQKWVFGRVRFLFESLFANYFEFSLLITVIRPFFYPPSIYLIRSHVY